jgi:hypothetical protein
VSDLDRRQHRVDCSGLSAIQGRPAPIYSARPVFIHLFMLRPFPTGGQVSYPHAYLNPCVVVVLQTNETVTSGCSFAPRLEIELGNLVIV